MPQWTLKQRNNWNSRCKGQAKRFAALKARQAERIPSPVIPPAVISGNLEAYAVLGIEPTATEREIRNAYRRLAKKYHPDVSQDKDAKERFQQIASAYLTLCPRQRKRGVFVGL